MERWRSADFDLYVVYQFDTARSVHVIWKDGASGIPYASHFSGFSKKHINVIALTSKIGSHLGLVQPPRGGFGREGPNRRFDISPFGTTG